jgi:glycosyltransferase involved in cell wall biosynthesis
MDMHERRTPSPAISFIVPAYNAEQTLRETLASIAAQSRTDWEAIVVDDGSTDDTARIAEGFGDARMVVVRQDNAGLAGARNAGLGRAAGECVCFLDADDVVRPSFAERMLGALGDDDAVACWYELVGPAGQPLAWTCMPTREDLAWDRLIRNNPLAVTAVVRRVSLVRMLGRVDAFNDALRVLEDWDLWLRLTHAGARWAPFVEEPLVRVRLRGGSLSQAVGCMHETGLGVIRTHARSEEECVGAIRHWNLLHAARYAASGDRDQANVLLRACEPLDRDDRAMFAGMYRSAMQRSRLVGPAATEALRQEWGTWLSRVLPDERGAELAQSLESLPVCWRSVGRAFANSLLEDDVGVVLGVGQNGREALAGACEVRAGVCWLDDRAAAGLPHRLSSQCRRIERKDLTPRHVVLVTPNGGEAISGDLRARGVRVFDRRKERTPA